MPAVPEVCCEIYLSENLATVQKDTSKYFSMALSGTHGGKTGLFIHDR